jgi:hypothetical protein
MDKREQLEFREHHTSGYPWQLQAWLSQVIIGHIRRGGDGVYRYYHGELNELNADLSDTDLDRLKEKIQVRGRR